MVGPIELKILNPTILLYGIPTRETLGSAGYDLRACTEEPITLLPDTAIKIPTGIAIHLNTREMAILLFPRSGLAANYSLTLQNAVGLVDSDYQGELQVLLRNEGTSPYKVNPGDRIAQLVFIPVFHPMIAVVQEFTNHSDRGFKGFGSTGVVSRPLTEATPHMPSGSGKVLPSQKLGNSSPIEVGEVLPDIVEYEPTGQELLEAEYGDD